MGSQDLALRKTAIPYYANVWGYNRRTAPVSGFYEFNAHYSHSAGSISLGYIALRVNGTEKARGNDIRTAMINMGIGVNKLLQLSANDYVEVSYYMSAASAVDVTSSAANYFTGFLVSRT